MGKKKLKDLPLNEAKTLKKKLKDDRKRIDQVMTSDALTLRKDISALSKASSGDESPSPKDLITGTHKAHKHGSKRVDPGFVKELAYVFESAGLTAATVKESLAKETVQGTKDTLSSESEFESGTDSERD